MDQGALHNTQNVFLILLGVIVFFAVVARRSGIPYPIVLVLAGVLLGFVPGAPRVELQPDLIFFIVLPPLLYSAAWLTSWRDFAYNIASISLLAFGLVAFTVSGVAWLAPLLLPGFTVVSGFVLGAVVSTTDAIAATAIARRLSLPRRIVDVLEGESLLNDASGLLALEIGLAMLVDGRNPSAAPVLLRLAYLVAVGSAVGIALGYLTNFLERFIEEGSTEVVISLLVPYAAYLAADSLHASGVLAVVACGLLLSRKSDHFLSPEARIQAFAFWESLIFLLNGLVFVLIGLQLPIVMHNMRAITPGKLVRYGLSFSALLIALRLVWTFPGAYLANRFRVFVQKQREPLPPVRSIFLVGWTGMRGVVALAAAISLPVVLSNGQPFPQRDFIIFLTFCVIIVTLVGQGLTLPIMIRKLGLVAQSGPDCEEEEARRIVIEAALARLDEMQRENRGQFPALYEDLTKHYRHRLFVVTGDAGDGDGRVDPEASVRYGEVSRELRQLERQTVERLRHERRINDEVMRTLQRELDLSDTRRPAD